MMRAGDFIGSPKGYENLLISFEATTSLGNALILEVFDRLTFTKYMGEFSYDVLSKYKITGNNNLLFSDIYVSLVCHELTKNIKHKITMTENNITIDISVNMRYGDLTFQLILPKIEESREITKTKIIKLLTNQVKELDLEILALKKR